MKLQQLRYLVGVADAGLNVTAAAQALHTSQPGVSRQIKLLEDELGFELFERSVRGMTLTRVAEQFRQRTSALRGALQEAVKEATDLHLGALGLLRVGVSPLYAQKLFVPAFVQLHRQRPAATVRASFAFYNTEEEVDRLADSLRRARAMAGG